MKSAQKQQGFTLIELLVATAISAVIAVLAYQSVSGVATLKQQVSQKQQRLTDLQRTQWQLQQDFMQMAPRPVRDAMGSLLPAVQLTNEEMVELTRFAEMPSPDQVGGLLRVRYQLQDDKLYRWVWPVLDRSPDTQPQKVLLLAGVKQFRVQFYDQKQQPQALWPLLSTNEDGQTPLSALPSLIRVQLKVLPSGVEEDSEQRLQWFFAGVDGLPANFSGFKPKKALVDGS